MSHTRNPRSERGVALLIVVSMLTVIGIMGVAFAFSMFLETEGARQFVSSTAARYVAEAGVAHARALLDEDRLGSRIDDATELWGTALAGQDVDADGNGTTESKWWPLSGSAEETAGRYGVLIEDEAGKANLNAGLANPSALDTGALNLTTLCTQAGLSQGAAVAEAIEQYRNGPDGKPGQALVDDDGDGSVDEADEYQPTIPRGDDRRLERLEDLAAVAELKVGDIRKLARLATVYSWDVNATTGGRMRLNVNTATAEELLAVLLDAGVEDPWQAAVNIADFVDSDFALSKVTKSSTLVLLQDEDPIGSWRHASSPVSHYETSEPDGAPLQWTMPVPAGRFRVLVRGISGTKVGDVTFAGRLFVSVDSGESLGMFTLNGTAGLTITDHEPAGTVCSFRGVELVPEVIQGGTVVRGLEAVRINELMVEPTQTYPVTAAAFDAQGSDWGCPLGGASCQNAGVGQGRWSWTDETLRPGYYHLKVFGVSAGQTVGDVSVNGQAARLVSGQRHPQAIAVGSDGKVTLTIGKSVAGETYYLTGISLSLQPDAEYVELINLSDKPVDVGGWTLDGEATGGRVAALPAGTSIPAHSLLVAAVDLDDAQTNLHNNISVRSAWELGQDAPAVQLEFPGGVPSADDDWLKVSVAGSGSARLTLRQDGAAVDDVEYPLPLPTTTSFQSLEKGDPGEMVDEDQDGLDDGWYPSLHQYTPGAPNDNDGTQELAGLEQVKHDPTQELSVRNRPLGGVGELAGVSSGQPWHPFASGDLIKIADLLTVEGMRLETEGHLTTGGEAWHETPEGYTFSGGSAEAAGHWLWSAILDGPYRLSLYGWSGEQMSLRWQQPDGTFSDWSPGLSADAQGRIVVGEITIGAAGSAAHTLVLEAKCTSAHHVCHLEHVGLDPQLIRIGPVNINTAPLEVLRALPGVTEAMASRIMTARPFGDQDGKGRGIGDLLRGDVLGATEEDRLTAFKRLAHLVTTRSDVFRILSTGQVQDRDGRIRATQSVEAVVQRSAPADQGAQSP